MFELPFYIRTLVVSELKHSGHEVHPKGVVETFGLSKWRALISKFSH